MKYICTEEELLVKFPLMENEENFFQKYHLLEPKYYCKRNNGKFVEEILSNISDKIGYYSGYLGDGYMGDDNYVYFADITLGSKYHLQLSGTYEGQIGLKFSYWYSGVSDINGYCCGDFNIADLYIISKKIRKEYSGDEVKNILYRYLGVHGVFVDSVIRQAVKYIDYEMYKRKLP